MQRTIPTLLVTAAAILPVGQTWAATHPSSRTSGAAHTHTAPKAKPKAKVTTRTFKGPVEDMRWGPVQVTIMVKGRRITDVRASAPMDRPRSAFINSQVLPILRQEVLKAQSANIDGISGATMTSYAFYDSLLGALKAAHKAHAL
jgi:uncharacterized protein with FMN-binding domain